jgi:glycyl-tRNA synthetase
MHEIDCTILTPEIVLKASGHLANFADIMVKDKITQEAFRVDHLLKAELEKKIKNDKSKDNIEINELKETLKKVENSQINDLEEIDKIISKFNIKSPSTGNDLTSASQFNLMFQTQFGPSSEKRR